MRRWHLLALLNIVGVLAAASVNGQSIVGTIVDDMDGRPIRGADVYVLSDTLVARTQSSSDGTFRIDLSSGGDYILSARMLGFASTDPAPLEVGPAEEVTVTLRLAREAILLDPLTVEVRRTSLRHAGTWDGFLARREVLPPIGNRRAIQRDDAEMEGSLTVQDVLRWLRPSGRSPGCMVTLVDGVRSQENIYNMSVSLIEGVEYYARVTDAPLDYAAQSGGCGVIVVWRRR
jgi:hypothetical protein